MEVDEKTYQSVCHCTILLPVLEYTFLYEIKLDVKYFMLNVK